MCQARTSVQISSILTWTILGSLTFGFCSIWSLHFVAMLACELDLPVGIDVPLTVLSSILAVFFTFVALATDLLWETQHRKRRLRKRASRPSNGIQHKVIQNRARVSSPNLGNIDEEVSSGSDDGSEHDGLLRDGGLNCGEAPEGSIQGSHTRPDPTPLHATVHGHSGKRKRDSLESQPESSRPSSTFSDSWRSPSFMSSTPSSHGLANIMHLAQRSTAPAKNAFVFTGEALYVGCTFRNIMRGLLWSLAITGMHYVGIAALRIPDGHLTLHPPLVILSALISWIVCLVGIILVPRLETHLSQQFLFAIVASTGVAAMHFTGALFVFFRLH